jgi:uncharacterized protein (TIGR03118 family)
VLFHLAAPAWATSVNVVNLVTDDQSAHPAQITDTGLVNAWGMSFSPTGPFVVSSNEAGTSPLYKVDPLTQTTTQLGLTISIPGAVNVTGQVFNGNASSFNGDVFLFVSEDGKVSGWRGALGTTAETLAITSGGIYTGAAISTIAGHSYLYAADFHDGTITAFKGDPAAPSLPGIFTDPGLPSGYAPFNVQNLGGSLYVNYAVQDAAKEEEVKGAGAGVVDKFDLQGNFLGRVATGGTLNAPWGLAIAPSSFGAMAGSLLVGNFGDGRINAFDATTHAFLGQVLGAGNQPLSIDGLRAISPGNDGNAGNSQLLYFTAGPDVERHGLFGVLTPVPEPSTFMLLLAGIGLIGLLFRSKGNRGCAVQ